MFGSFKCKECSSTCLLQLLYALAGIFIVALLFFFNMCYCKEPSCVGCCIPTSWDSWQTSSRACLRSPFLPPVSLQPTIRCWSVSLWIWSGRHFFSLRSPSTNLFTLLIVIIITHKCGYSSLHSQESHTSTGHYHATDIHLSCECHFCSTEVLYHFSL